MGLDPKRTVAELRELQELTGDENGAQRVAWTDTWVEAREWLSKKVAETGAAEETDHAGNQWFTLGGDRRHRASTYHVLRSPGCSIRAAPSRSYASFSS